MDKNSRKTHVGQREPSESSVPTHLHRRAPLEKGRVLVLGLGRSGRAVVEYLLPLVGDRVEGLAVAAGREDAKTRAWLESLGDKVTWAFGDDAVQTLAAAAGAKGEGPAFTVAVASPGIPPHAPLYQDAVAVSREVIGEVELAWRESDPESVWAAVTGTNGKTTVTAMLAHGLGGEENGVAPVGNIGEPAIEAISRGLRTYVVEMSSYQLHSCPTFLPQAAVVLGITPDHLSWHGSFEAYRDAKLSLANRMAEHGRSLVIDATDATVRTWYRARRQSGASCESIVPVGTADGLGSDMRVRCGSPKGAYVDKARGEFVIGLGPNEEIRVPEASRLQVHGAHNLLNASCVAAAACLLGEPANVTGERLRSFSPLEHRIEPCGELRGIRFFNDSKATNVDATLAAIASFPGQPLIVLLGGRDKGTDLAPLVEAAAAHAKAVVLYGESSFRFVQAFGCAFDEGSGCPYALTDTLDEALDEALRLADAGDVILLSPACASFDQYRCFEERGDAFKALVRARMAELGA